MAHASGPDTAAARRSGATFALAELWRPASLADYKVHFARRNNEREQPLHAFARSFEAWTVWQRTYPGKNDFNRPKIFSLIQMPQAPALWLFGGVFRVEGIVAAEDGGRCYKVTLTDELRPLIGRLTLAHDYRQRATRVNLERHHQHFVVHQISPEAYSGPSFPGYADIHLSFEELEALIAGGRQDWSAALSHVKGVYLITDDHTRRRYVGSACGDEGVWSRWTTYSRCGHGGNLGMRDLLAGHDLLYCRRHFRFALLETFERRTPDEVVLRREAHWKEVLGTRDVEAGLNRN